MIRPALAALALIGSFCTAGTFVSPTAEAQAPVRRAMSSTEMTQRILDLEGATVDATQLRQDNARLRLEIRELNSQLSGSTGKIERLEFQLGAANEEIEALQSDNREIGQQLRELTGRLNALEAGLRHSSAVSDPTAGGVAPAGPGGPSAGFGTVDPLPDDGVESVAPDSPGATGGPVDLIPTPAGSIAPDPGVPTPPAPRSQPSVQPSAQAVAMPSAPLDLFEFGKSRLVQFDYVGAEAAFSAFLDAHGDHERASEAQYWLGEVQYQLEDYAASGATYTSMIRSYPDDPRAADALVKLARSMRLVGETAKACAALGAIDSRYPNASAVTRNLANSERVKAQCN